MKYLLLSLLFLITLICSLNKVSNSHGSKFIDKKYDKIVLNNTNKNDETIDEKFLEKILLDFGVKGEIKKNKSWTSSYLK